MQDMKKYGVLFVCTGNICRSPTAEGIFRHIVVARGLGERFRIDSAGTHGYHIGEPPDRRSIAAAASRGIDISGLRARKIVPADFSDFDLIMALDSGHYRILARMIPANSVSKLSMFMDFPAAEGNRDVPDPYYGESRDFEMVLDMVEEGAGRLLQHLEKEL